MNESYQLYAPVTECNGFSEMSALMSYLLLCCMMMFIYILIIVSEISASIHDTNEMNGMESNL